MPPDPQMFPELPGDLSSVEDDDLGALLEEFRAVARSIHEGDDETLGDRTAEQIVAEMQAGVEAIEAITAEQTSRVEAAENFAAGVAELAARAGLEAETPEGEEGDDDDGEEEPSEESVTADEAAGAPQTASARQVRRPGVSRRHRPAPQTEPEGASLVASTITHPYAEPSERLTKQRLAELQSDMINKRKLQPKERVVVASAQFDYPEERTLGGNGALNQSRIADAIPGYNSLTASGGLCAPLTPIYSMPDFETSSRPVRDALAGFRADRGGVIVPQNPVITDYADAVGIVTEAQDAAGGTFAVKNCMRIECPEFDSVTVNAIYRCVEIGNLTGKAYPELLSRVDTLVMANWARAAETELLDQIRAGSTIVVGTASATGAVWEFFGHMIAAAAGYRSRHRMATNARLEALAPEWLVDLIQLDHLRNAFKGEPATRGQIEDFLGRAGVNITFYKDGPTTNTAQVFGAQTAGNLLEFPTDVQWALFAPGSWLFLDSGSLDLGIVRDSTLNSTNDYQVFAESWEAAAFVGVESEWITSSLCPNGTYSAGKDFSALCTF